MNGTRNEQRLIRWEKAFSTCMRGVGRGGGGRWKGDPSALRDEAHQMPLALQCQVLELLLACEAVTEEHRRLLRPVWRYSFALWVVYDVWCEVSEKNGSIVDALDAPDTVADLTTLAFMAQGGQMESQHQTERWMWDLLEPMPDAPAIDGLWDDQKAAPLLAVARRERKAGTVAFGDGRYGDALGHFLQGLREIAPAPATVRGPHAKLRGDLLKNKAAVALKLGLHRIALEAADAALVIDSRDEKAWYRKAAALQGLGRKSEAAAASSKAGLSNSAAEEAAARLGQAGPRDDETESCAPDGWEEAVFLELGIDSLAAVDFLRHVQAEMPDVPLAPTLIFDFPVVGDAVTELQKFLNGKGNPVMRRRLAGTVWRAIEKAISSYPFAGEGSEKAAKAAAADAPDLSEEEALGILVELRAAYEELAFVEATRHLARRVSFEQRTYLINLRPLALDAQIPTLERLGLQQSALGMRRLEVALIRVARSSEAVRDAMAKTRVAVNGGSNGIWCINMEADDAPYGDANGMMNRYAYLKSDPFAATRPNTWAPGVTA